MTSFNALYKLLDIHFDYIQGESFDNDKLTDTVALLEQKDLLKRDRGAYIVELEDLSLALIKKSEGASFYITRDLSVVLYRTATFDPSRILYVVGQAQSILRKSGYVNNDKEDFQFEENMWAFLKHLKSYNEV